MSYVDQRLAACVAYGFSGGPKFNTEIIPYDNGLEQRNRKWLHPKHEWSANFLNLGDEARDLVMDAYYALAGRWGGFRFQDKSSRNQWNAINEPLIVSAGTSTPAQLIRERTFGGLSTIQRIQAPVAGTVSITKDGLPFTAFTVNTDLGLITPDAPWAAGAYLATFEHDHWVRFDNDHNAFSIDSPGAHNSAIVLVEVWRRT